MKFEKLNEMIPYVVGGKQKILSMHPYNGITLRMPGRHAKDTTPVGGDFVVCVDDETLDWTEHQFTHTDIFQDLELRRYSSAIRSDEFLRDYLNVVQGADPSKLSYEERSSGLGNVMHPQTFMYAVQCLAVAEHRRYAHFEQKFGGRYLPFRFGAGIIEGLWTAADAIDKQKRGRPGVEWLEKDHGVPVLTKELMS